MSPRPRARDSDGTILPMLDIPVPDHPTTLADWLAHAERLHPVTIDRGWSVCSAWPSAWAWRWTAR